jgi:hypothetical protein
MTIMKTSKQLISHDFSSTTNYDWRIYFETLNTAYVMFHLGEMLPIIILNVSIFVNAIVAF